MQLKQLGERKIIEIIRGTYGYEWPDSDCSWIDIGSKYLLITTDSISQQGHMPKGATPEEIGYFFAAVNLSDIAAMGGIPKYFMAALIIPKTTNIEFLKGLERGIKRCLDKYGTKMIGGDLKEGEQMVLTGIAIGEVEKARMMRRTEMKKGEAVLITGTLGGNSAAYYLWKNGRKDLASRLISVEPRIREGRFISDNGVKAAMDISDGIYSMVHQLSRKNRIGFEIDLQSVPVHPLAKEASRKLGISIDQLCLNYGGEYQLLFTLPERKVAGIISEAQKSRIRITRIGRVIKDGNFIIDGKKRTPITKRGYEHFS